MNVLPNRRRRRAAIPALLAMLAAAAGLRAHVELSPLFSDHAVLQQGMPVPVWGTAAPGEHVEVSFRDRSVGATAGPDGRWIALLGPMEPSADPSDLTAAGARDSAACHDVLVGEVWLCSGQSNMEFTVDVPANRAFKLDNAAAEVAAARYPLIRQFHVARNAAASPDDSLSGQWTPCSPASVGAFTAVGYFFARDLHRRIGVPVGILDSCWGGTPVEAWMAPASLAGDPSFAVVAERWRREPPPPDYPHRPAWRPAGLFDGMIHPLLPYALRGVLWYQGESNADRALEYHRLFTAMIEGWRSGFGQASLPFYWVQLPGYKDPHDPTGQRWAYLREAQARTLSLAGTGMAVTIDIGDPKNIHPGHKQEVGRRLALIAKARVYGITVDYAGPVFRAAERIGSKMRVSFDNADNGLTAADKPLQSFELAGADRIFHPATATIDGGTVVVSSAAVPNPVAVRYAWSDCPDANLYNGAGLPAAPFRSDDW